jgi:hypothetical protein
MSNSTRSLLLGLGAGAAVLLTGALATAAGASSLATAWSVAVALAIGVVLTHRWKTELFAAQRDALQQVARRLDLLQDQLSETQGLVQLVRFDDRYPMPFGGGWALTADAGAVLVREVALRRPRIVVELGSGVSTLLVGRMLKEAGAGKLYSLDHDAAWAERTRAHVRASGLEDFVVVLDAPLTSQRHDGDEYEWYTLPEEVAQLREIDLLVVDGPPQSLSPNGIPRYPALPVFGPKLSADAFIYVDDAKRPQEQRMIEAWLKRDPSLSKWAIQTAPGTCLLTRGR